MTDDIDLNGLQFGFISCAMTSMVIQHEKSNTPIYLNLPFDDGWSQWQYQGAGGWRVTPNIENLSNYVFWPWRITAKDPIYTECGFGFYSQVRARRLTPEDFAHELRAGAHRRQFRGIPLLCPNLRYLHMAYTDLSGINFNQCDLTGATFIQCNFDSADFTDAQLDHARFLDCYLREAKFVEANAQSTCFDGSDLVGAEFTDAILPFASFWNSRNVDLSGAADLDLVGYTPSDAAHLKTRD